ncbi:MAG: N-acetylmuramoyl-L-alanine amidase [Clostridia bacterium]
MLNNTYSNNNENNDSKKSVLGFFEKYALPLIILFGMVVAIMGLIVNIGSSLRISASLDPKATNLPIPSATAPTSIEPFETPVTSEIPKVSKIIIDAGHGGFDPGTKGNESGIYEREINLSIATYLKELLEQHNYDVVMTRENENALDNTKEGDMKKRETIIRESDANLFVSIHQNWFERRDAHGPQVFYRPESAEGKIFADIVQKSMNMALEIDTPREISAAEHRLTKILPGSILIECGFLSNKRDEMLLSTAEYQKKVAQSIFDAIEVYRKGK